MNNDRKCGNCKAVAVDQPCNQKNCPWFIEDPEHFCCFHVYKYFLQDCEHTLQEVALKLGISHTTVKQQEALAIKKLQDSLKRGEISERDLRNLLKIKR